MHIDRFRVRAGDRSMLTRLRPDEHGQLTKDAAAGHLKKGIKRLEARQERLYARGESSLLLIFQGLDGSGKDSAIKHVMSGVNPQGTEVHSFRTPSEEDLEHDYLWRAAKVLPARGRIGIFNRSYYEEVLIVRVHPKLLTAERLPTSSVTPRVWKERFEDIRAFERHLFRNGTVIRKFFLYLSRAEQRKRLLARLDDPSKVWKFRVSDLAERDHWRAYMTAFREMLSETSVKDAPWFVIPADHKWFAHLLIAEVIVQALDSLVLSLPKPGPDERLALQQARRRLL